ncbi:hypothetical protein DFJ73DRAFT_852920 [Zopfochytrium polystomum]|nr:hypothetical protein DFJ73DRAFT_852920 [Zopfochytrium polystomum]
MSLRDRSIFTPEELVEQKFLELAISRAEHTHAVRLQLRAGGGGGGGGISASFSDGDSKPIAQKQLFAAGLPGGLKRRGRAGNVGYDQLVLRPLSKIEVGDRRSSANQDMLESISHVVKKSVPSITSVLKSIVGDIESVAWLNPEEREQLVNTFISDLAYRYNRLQDLIITHLTPDQNRTFIIKLFERIGVIKNIILEKCRQKKASMDKVGVFAEDANSARVISFFRTELHKRINSTDLTKNVMREVEGGAATKGMTGFTEQDIFQLELQEFKDALDSVTHPVPKVEMPDLPRSYHQSSMRNKLLSDAAGGGGAPETSPHRFANTTGPLPIHSHLQAKSRLSPWRRTSRPSTESAIPDYRAAYRDMLTILAKNQEKEVDEDGVSVQQTEIAGDENPTSKGDEEEERRRRGDVLDRRDDPILAAHSVSTLFTRRTGNPAPINTKPRTRYLFPQKKIIPYLSNFDYSFFDKAATPSPDGEIENQRILPDNSVIRTMGSKISQRIPKGFISLSAEPASAVSEFGSEVDSKVLDTLDERLSRHKEVEELYDEIMKTIVGNHLDTDDSEAEIQNCPAAPYDPKIPLSNAYLGIVVSAFPTRASPPPPDPSEDFETPRMGGTPTSTYPEIRMTTRSNGTVTVAPDEFIADRAAAMRKTPSSRYGASRYNFGGYVPFDMERKKKKRVEVFHHDDYLHYLRTRTCDFILDLLVDSEEDARAMKKAMEEEEGRKTAEEARLRAEKEREAKLERRRRLTEYQMGVWNAGTLEFMEEIQKLPQSELDELRESENEARSEANREEQEGQESDDENSARDEPVQNQPHTTVRVSRALAKRTSSTVDITAAQQELENLWVTLKMPIDQKLDMAIKYGSYKFAPKLEMAIKLWKNASDLIIERESMMKDFEKFELTASDPERFFRSGFDGSSEARMEESRVRDDFLQRLHWIEARISDVVRMIKYELNETVTYKGIPYLEKVKTDYLEMMRRTKQEREEKGETK